MNKKRLALALILVFLFLALIPTKSEVQKEIEYYIENGHTVYFFDFITEWYPMLI
jgi:hypothetical protein